MTKIRLLFFLVTIAVVGSIATALFLYAKGVRLDLKSTKLQEQGLLVAKSNPDGAQIYVDGELITATNATTDLKPGTYDLEIKKEGFRTWYKRIQIDRGVVTEVTAHLFKSAPSLTPITFTTTVNPVASSDFTKVAYAIPATKENVESDTAGLFVIEAFNLPLGFAQEPKRITDGNLDGATWEFSPNGQELLLSVAGGAFLLDATRFTPQAQRVNILPTLKQTRLLWEEERLLRLESKLRKLPDELVKFLSLSNTKVIFSPDEKRILYESTSSFNLKDNLVSPLPGSSTQKQERDVKKNRIYVYDIKEDRNFLIAEKEITNDSDCDFTTSAILVSCTSSVVWFPTSLNLLIASSNHVVISDYDGTNQQQVYSGSYISPNAFATTSDDRVILLTNLGAESQGANLYSLSVK